MILAGLGVGITQISEKHGDMHKNQNKKNMQRETHTHTWCNSGICVDLMKDYIKYVVIILYLFNVIFTCNVLKQYTLWLFNIAMEAMAHRNRWFTY